jgi:3-demethoxyubiquinol 3-hydroxylase
MSRPAQTIAEKMIKVDHAGENGAVNIYRGQHAVARFMHPRLCAGLAEFQGHEKEHRAIFQTYLADRGIRRCISYHACGCGGLALGLITALMGARAIAATTYAVEHVVLGHLNEQMTYLRNHDTTALHCVAQIRGDEQAHHDEAAEQMGAPDWLTCCLIRVVAFSTECVIRFGMR